MNRINAITNQVSFAHLDAVVMFTPADWSQFSFQFHKAAETEKTFRAKEAKMAEEQKSIQRKNELGEIIASCATEERKVRQWLNPRAFFCRFRRLHILGYTIASRRACPTCAKTEVERNRNKSVEGFGERGRRAAQIDEGIFRKRFERIAEYWATDRRVPVVNGRRRTRERRTQESRICQANEGEQLAT